MYTNERAQYSVWVYGNRSMSSDTGFSYDLMACTHLLINENDDTDLIESAKLLLRTHGKKIEI